MWLEKIPNWIDGDFQDPGRWLPNEEPAIGKVTSQFADSSAADVDAAVRAARAAFLTWSQTSPLDRAKVLRNLADLVEENLEAFATAECRDTGKPISTARTVDIPRSIKNLRFFADAVENWKPEVFAGQGSMNETHWKPLGVVATISPWNLPLYLFSWKIAPALAAGNCVVAKPSEVTPMTAALLAQLSPQAGLPPGVFNVVQGRGSEVGAALSQHPDIKALSFTGSTLTGRRIHQDAAGTLKKLSLEMGGKNPFIVFDDVDLEVVVPWAVRAAFSNQGQICLCGSRFLIAEGIYAKFRDRFAEGTRSLRVGDPLEASTQFGSLVSKLHFEKVSSAVEHAKQLGGRVILGGEKIRPEGRCQSGYFYAPTIIEGLDNSCATNQEEIFGPVVTLQTFNNEAEALKLANDSSYGLAASVWRKDFSAAKSFAQKLESGIVWINTWMNRDLRTPFGGVKNSGFGREGGRFALEFFSEPQNICWEDQT